MADAAVLDDEPRGHRPRGVRRRLDERDREAAAHHVGVVDAAPEMTAVRHVAVLALHARGREAARLPLRVGVLEQRAVQRVALGAELVAAAAELRGQIGGRARHPAVRQRLARRRGGERAVAPRWTEALVAADVARRARDPARAQRRVEGGVPGERAGHERRLLGERRVAVLAGEGRRRLAYEQLGKLAGHARAHGRRVRARAPVGELRGMTRAARLGGERRLERREAGRRRSLRGQRHAPVARDERLDGLRARAERARGAARDEQSPRWPRARSHGHHHSRRLECCHAHP